MSLPAHAPSGPLVLIIPDGAAEPVADGRPTALEDARTPALDAVCAVGVVRRVVTTRATQEPGSETGIPALLGIAAHEPVSRGAIEAAAVGIELTAGERAWRIDLHREDGTRVDADVASAWMAATALRLPDHRLIHLRGHRGLAIGATMPVVAADGDLAVRVWGDGAVPEARVDGGETVVVSGPGAAAGCARLFGAVSIVPSACTGGVDTDYGSKRLAALDALGGGADVLVVHVGAPDEAAHVRDRDGKVRALEAVDRELVAPLWEAVCERGGTLVVCPDHGTDPRTGLHDGAPVPAAAAGAGIAPEPGARRMTERAARTAPLTDPRSIARR